MTSSISPVFLLLFFLSRLSAVCAFPYILAFTTDSIEIRLVVNGNLVYTAVVPELQLVASRVSASGGHGNSLVLVMFAFNVNDCWHFSFITDVSFFSGVLFVP